MKTFSLLTGAALVLAAVAMTAYAQTNTVSLKLDDETRNMLRETTQDRWFKKDAFMSVVLGGLLATVGGIGASWYSHHLESRRNRKEDEEFKSNVLRAIRWELEAAGKIYDNGIGKYLKELPDGQMFEMRLGLTQDWFTVFNANAVHLGKIDGEISRRLVGIYAMMKGLIEEFRINNEYLTQRANVDFEILHRSNEQHLKERRKIVERWMISQAIKLKSVDESLKAAVNELYALLDKKDIK